MMRATTALMVLLLSAASARAELDLQTAATAPELDRPLGAAVAMRATSVTPGARLEGLLGTRGRPAELVLLIGFADAAHPAPRSGRVWALEPERDDDGK